MEDKKISEAVELLYRGAKMLSQHCPDCKVPLFKDGDRIFCPSCKREVIFEDSKLEQSAEKETKDSKPIIESDLESILKNVIVDLALKLKERENLQEVKEIIELISKLVDLIEKLKRLEYI